MAGETYVEDPRVDAYIDALPDWQQGICQQVRDLVHGADPEVVETIKRTVQPYFVLDGNVAALLSRRTTSPSSCTTEGSRLTPRGSSPAATATRPGG